MFRIWEGVIFSFPDPEQRANQLLVPCQLKELIALLNILKLTYYVAQCPGNVNITGHKHTEERQWTMQKACSYVLSGLFWCMVNLWILNPQKIPSLTGCCIQKAMASLIDLLRLVFSLPLSPLPPNLHYRPTIIMLQGTPIFFWSNVCFMVTAYVYVGGAFGGQKYKQGCNLDQPCIYSGGVLCYGIRGNQQAICKCMYSQLNHLFFPRWW